MIDEEVQLIIKQKDYRIEQQYEIIKQQQSLIKILKSQLEQARLDIYLLQKEEEYGKVSIDQLQFDL